MKTSKSFLSRFNLSRSLSSSLFFLLCTVPFQSNHVSAQSNSPTNPNSNNNNIQGSEVTVAILWQDGKSLILPVQVFPSRVSKDRAFGISSFDEDVALGAIIVEATPGTECTIGTSPYAGGNEFTYDVHAEGPISASFVACTVVEPVIEAELVDMKGVERQEYGAGGDGGGIGGSPSIEQMDIIDVVEDDGLGNGQDESRKTDVSSGDGPIGVPWIQDIDANDFQRAEITNGNDNGNGDGDDDDDTGRNDWMIM